MSRRKNILPGNFWSIEPASFSSLMMQLRQPITKIATEKPSMVAAPVAAMVSIIADEDDPEYRIVNGVAIIEIDGPLTKHGYCWWCAPYSYIEIQRLVKLAADDAAVNAILLVIDSPGGEVAGVSDLANAIFDARDKKPVHAFISDSGCSAAYYVASQAQRIYCDVDAVVGCIGVLCVIDDWSKYYEELGIKTYPFRSAELKAAGMVTGEPMTDAAKAELQRHVMQLHETFVEAIVRGRGVTPEKAMLWADGRTHIGRHAKALGLVDEITTIDAVVRELSDISLGRKQPQ